MGKKLTSLLLALTLCLGLAIPVWAAVDAAEPKADPEAVQTVPEDEEIAPEGDIHCTSEDDEGIMPLGEPHCGSGATIGVLVTKTEKKQVGSDVRNCIHGVIGATDVRYQYAETSTTTCTRCDYKRVVMGAPYWGDWTCPKGHR